MSKFKVTYVRKSEYECFFDAKDMDEALDKAAALLDSDFYLDVIDKEMTDNWEADTNFDIDNFDAYWDECKEEPWVTERMLSPEEIASWIGEDE